MQVGCGGGDGSARREVFKSVNALKATGSFLVDGLSPLNKCVCDSSSAGLQVREELSAMESKEGYIS